jgi:hypothetical protein
LADKSTRMILEALSRAATEPEGFPLLAGKNEPGLFAPTSAAKILADRCRDDGLLEIVRTETRGKLTRDICRLTEKGMQYLIRESSPRQILEDFVRILESRENEILSLTETLRKMHAGLQGMQSAISGILPKLTADSPDPHRNGTPMNTTHAAPPTRKTTPDALFAELRSRLAEWHAGAGASQDCPLPTLYRQLSPAGEITIGQFHDCLRRLHADHQIWLHPWTGPLYALPEPALALLVGHEIAYYVSLR